MAKRRKSVAQIKATNREKRAQEITRLTNSLNELRAQMLANVSTWKYEQMAEALTRANNINKELKKLL